MKGKILKPEQINKFAEMARFILRDRLDNEDLPYINEKIGLELYVQARTYFVYIDRDDGCTRIHWLEFIIFYIIPKLDSHVRGRSLQSIKEDFIDRIYDNFKHKYL